MLNTRFSVLSLSLSLSLSLVNLACHCGHAVEVITNYDELTDSATFDSRVANPKIKLAE